MASRMHGRDRRDDAVCVTGIGAIQNRNTENHSQRAWTRIRDNIVPATIARKPAQVCGAAAVAAAIVYFVTLPRRRHTAKKVWQWASEDIKGGSGMLSEIDG